MSAGSDAREIRVHPARVRQMLDGGRRREQPATPEQVAAVWRKAVQSARDAELMGMSIDGGIRGRILPRRLSKVPHL